MSGWQSQLQTEVQTGLLTLLSRFVSPDDDDARLTVVTTAPAQWLRSPAGETMRVLDISGLTGLTMWTAADDLQDSTLEKILAAGWKDSQIQVQPAPTPRSHISPDFVLLGPDSRPFAVVEAKPSALLFFSHGLMQVQSLALQARARLAIVTDGRRTLIHDLRTGTTREVESFPSPHDVGLQDISTSEAQEALQLHGDGPIRIAAVSELMEAIASHPANPLVIDYTLPWGPLSLLNSVVGPYLPNHIQPEVRHDAMAVLLLAIVNAAAPRRLVTLGADPQKLDGRVM